MFASNLVAIMARNATEFSAKGTVSFFLRQPLV